MKTFRHGAILGIVLMLGIGLSTSAMGAKKGGHAGPVEKIREATAQLNLTDDQQPKVNQILRATAYGN